MTKLLAVFKTPVPDFAKVSIKSALTLVKLCLGLPFVTLISSSFSA